MNRSPLLERRSPLGIPYALLILVVIFFFLPSGFRAARLSVERKENNVKDWLPSDFPETAELEWFADHFVGESFVLATWDGCTSGNQNLKLFEQKLRHESETFDAMTVLGPAEAENYAKAKAIGNQLQLLRSSNEFVDWGGQKEKWLRTPSGQWYYITPKGHLYRWQEGVNGPAAAVRAIRRRFDSYQIDGQFVAALGKEPAGDQTNPYYNDPSIFCAPLFHTVQTGDSIVEELAGEGGPLWPIDLTDALRRPVVARRRAIERLTGTLFAPAVPTDFAWTPTAFRAALTADGADPPPEFEALVQQELDQVISDRFDGSAEALKSAAPEVQTEVWYSVFDAAEVEAPARLTCVLVTLTDVAKDNLPYPLGRGVMGQPRGRLLQLAAESGITPAAAPSMAPPPFNREAPESVGGKPALRLGGPPVDNMAIDEEGSITLVRLVGYSVVLGVVLSFLCFGSIRITIMVFFVGGSAAMLSMAMVWWTGGTVDAILMSMPSLVYVLGLSGAIHVINYYRDEVRARGEPGAAGRALRHAFLPCTLASVTTAIGLISLHTSNLAPISNFGLYSAIGVILTLGILFSFLPAALETFTPGIGEHGHPDAETDPSAPEESWLSDWWASIGRWIAKHHGPVSIASIVVLLISSVGLMNIKTSVQLLKLFDPDSRIISDYAWMESNFGKLVPMELIVRMPPAIQATDDADEPTSLTSLQMIERVEAATRVRTAVYRTLGGPGLDIVGQATGADTFLPPVPAPTNGYSPIRSKFNRELLSASDQLRDNDYLRIEKSGPYAGSELWRISLRVAALSDVDYGQFISTLRETAEPIVRAYDTREALLKSLKVNDDGQPSAKTRVLVVGSNRPEALAQTELINDDGSINTRRSYIATLGELLSGERIEQPEWREVTAEKARQLAANDKWERYITSFDAVIWLGSEGFTKQNFASAKNLIDGEAIRLKSVQPTLSEGRIPDVSGAGPIQIIYTGIVPVVYKAQRTLLTSLTKSIGLAFVLIAVVMILLLNPGRAPFGWFTPSNIGDGFMAGMIAMIPNVFPVLLVFGVMCHMGIAIDIGTMMTASVAMGVAVDDTIHFLSWFREHLDRGMNRVDAVIETYRRVGPAMTQTTIVGGLGLFVFALSTFTPTQRFGTLMLVMLATALVGDLILLPALLAGPLGRFFKPRKDANGNPVKAKLQIESKPTVEDPTEGDPSPHLQIHFPAERTDPPHRVK